MAAEPITIFTHRDDIAPAVTAVRSIVSDAVVESSDDGWRSIRVESRRGILRRASFLQISQDPEYDAEPNWSKQMQGMTGYLSRWPRSEKTSGVLSLITALRHSLGTIAEPELDPDRDSA